MLTRERMLQAAIEVFGRLGFRAATIDEITKCAGANRATFYLHFQDKHDIAASVAQRTATAMAEHFRALDNLADPTPATLRAWLLAHMAARRKDWILMQVIHEAAASDSRFDQKFIDYYHRIVSRVMIRTVARWPEDQQPQFRTRVQCVLMMMQRMGFHLIRGDIRPADSELLIDALAGILWNEVFSPPGAPCPAEPGVSDAAAPKQPHLGQTGVPSRTSEGQAQPIQLTHESEIPHARPHRANTGHD